MLRRIFRKFGQLPLFFAKVKSDHPSRVSKSKLREVTLNILCMVDFEFCVHWSRMLNCMPITRHIFDQTYMK